MLLLVGGCITTPLAPEIALNDARSTIQAAEKDDASHYANAELDEARQKLILADRAVATEDMVLAERLAHESAATAKLAAARTEAKKAAAINTEMSRGADALMEEMQRIGDQQ
ncbi:MAG: DUF4398 domain-containing protein [Gammaproteobacteria bacterium]|nr:DUF4398 domain-containing protein [Gammaproteobacteria bacterium]